MKISVDYRNLNIAIIYDQWISVAALGSNVISFSVSEDVNHFELDRLKVDKYSVYDDSVQTTPETVVYYKIQPCLCNNLSMSIIVDSSISGRLVAFLQQKRNAII